MSTSKTTQTVHLRTPRTITDGEGNIVSRRDFMPFGVDLYNGVGARDSALKYSTTEDDVRQKFTGYQKDEETGLDFAEARMYENRHARFTAVDPLLASGESTNPQTLNRYVYVANSPLIFTDPTGLVRDWVSVNGETIYDSDITSQAEAEEKYGEDAVHRENGSTIEASDGQSYALFAGGLYEIGVGSGQFELQNDRAFEANNLSGSGLAFAFINPTFLFKVGGFRPPQQNNNNRARGRYSRLPMNYFNRTTPNRYVVPPPNLGGSNMMFNPNNVGTSIGNGVYVPHSPSGMWNAPHVSNRSGRRTNCVNCTIANDATQAGRPTSALPSPVQPHTVLENRYKGNFKRMTRTEITHALSNAKPGSRAAIIGSRGPGQNGHVWNGFNINGRVVFSDRQNAAGRASWSGYREYYFLWTHTPNN